jgi:hypothetical protein
MSLKLDVLFRDKHTAVLNVPKTPARAVEEQLRDATDGMQSLLHDDYDAYTVLSLFWDSDNTGAALDSDLFLATMKEHRSSVETISLTLEDKSLGMDVTSKIAALTTTRKASARSLFVFHYAGHGWGRDSLHLCPRIQDPDADELESDAVSFSFTPVKDMLKEVARGRGFDVLFLMDCCCAPAGGRNVRRKMKGLQIEFVAATTGRGISDSRDDGQTFTMAWCEAFRTLQSRGKPFNVEGVREEMSKQKNLARFPAITIFEGIDLPIIFRPRPATNIVVAPTSPTLPPNPARTVIAAFHLTEDPQSEEVLQLIDFLTRSPVGVSVLAALPSKSTWLLLRMPSALKDFINAVPALVLQEEE